MAAKAASERESWWSRESFRHLKRERRWTDQVRDEATLSALPLGEQEFAAELVQSLPELIGNLSPASRAVVVFSTCMKCRL